MGRRLLLWPPPKIWYSLFASGLGVLCVYGSLASRTRIQTVRYSTSALEGVARNLWVAQLQEKQRSLQRACCRKGSAPVQHYSGTDPFSGSLLFFFRNAPLCDPKSNLLWWYRRLPSPKEILPHPVCPYQRYCIPLISPLYYCCNLA